MLSYRYCLLGLVYAEEKKGGGEECGAVRGAVNWRICGESEKQ